MSYIVIDDDNFEEHLPAFSPYSGGLVPRDFAAQPVGSLPFLRKFDLPLIPRANMPAMVAAHLANKTSLQDIRDRGMFGQRIPSRDQDGYGYCWAHSTVSANLLARARDGQPFADLSAFGVAAPIKNFRNQGGNGIDSVEYASAKGIPTSATWPQQSMARSNVNDAMYADAGRHKNVVYYELDPSDPQYLDQFLTAVLLNMPVVSDFNWWGHSVCTARIKQFDPSSPVQGLVTTIWNSWSDDWSDAGMGDLKGRRAVPDNAIAIGLVTASAA